jgi:DNA polymerase III epsilon subunit-like protein
MRKRPPTGRPQYSRSRARILAHRSLTCPNAHPQTLLILIGVRAEERPRHATRPAGSETPPSALADRAFELLASRGAVVPTTELAGWVFGAREAAPWVPLLDGLLRTDPRVERCLDGWRLAGDSAAERWGAEELVAVALATTGPDPRRHRIVRLAATRLSSGRVSGRFDVVLNPLRRVARYLSEGARLTQEEADEAPVFAEVAPALREFLGDAPIVGYGVRAALEFLQAEFARAELTGLTNRAVELDTLACRLLPTQRKPSLPSIAEQLGLNHPRPSYPPADADVTARVAVALIRLAGERGLEDQSGIGSGGGAATAGAVLADRRWLTDVPAGPGVYTIHDSDGGVLYVGKAVDLRRRLAAYLAGPLGLQRRLEGLAARAARVDWVSAPSDLEARLLEARLIRRHRPPFNVARRMRPRSLLIRAAAHDRVPRIQLARQVAADGAVYLGPFRSEGAARAALSLARAVYPPAGLRRVVDLPTQQAAVHAAVRLLSGQTSEALASLRTAMRDASTRGDRPAVDRGRELIRRVVAFTPLSSPLLGTSLSEPILLIEPPRATGARRAHLMAHGHLRASCDLHVDPAAADPTELLPIVAELEAGASDPDHDEDAHIVTQWLGEVGAAHVIVPLRRLPGRHP